MDESNQQILPEKETKKLLIRIVKAVKLHGKWFIKYFESMRL